MKRCTLAALLLLAVISGVFAQKPVKGDWGLGFRLTGLNFVSIDALRDGLGNPQIFGRRYLSDKYAVRATFGLNLNNTESQFSTQYVAFAGGRFPNNTLVDSLNKSTGSGMTFSLSPGFEWHLSSTNSKLDPYVGVELPIMLKGATTEETQSKFSYFDQGRNQQIYAQDLKVKTVRDGGLGIGLNLVGGFNYFFTDHIAIGAEYAFGLANQTLGGDYTFTRKGPITPTSDLGFVINVDETIKGKEYDTETGVGVRSQGGIILSIFW